MMNQDVFPETMVVAEGHKPSSQKKTSRLGRLMGASAMAVATTLAGCAATNDSREKQLDAQVAELQNLLEHCQEKSPDLSHDSAVLSYGTFGVRWLFLNKPNILTAGKGLEQVEQTFLFWPPVASASEITVEGNAGNFTSVQVGSAWNIVFKSKENKPRESLVIEVKGQRYVLFIDRR
jgi:hypothetical protein